VDTTTALNGDDIDAVAASLIEGGAPKVEDEETADILVQAEADAESQTDAADDGEEVDTSAAEDTDEASDDSEADAAEEDTTEQLYTVKVSGREQQVPLSELLRGYSGQAYIQQGMSQVAQAKQEVEQVYTALQSERQQLAQFMQAAQAGQLPMQPPQPPDDSLLQSDPIGYLEARVKYDKDVAAWQQSRAQVQEMTARQAEAEERARMAYLADQHKQLVQAIPAFAQPETAAKLKQDLINLGSDVYGYTPDELRAVSDMRAIRVLHDAAQYRKLMAGKAAPDAAQRAPQTRPIKPGVKQQPTQGKVRQSEQAKAQMKRTGSVDDVARFLLM